MPFLVNAFRTVPIDAPNDVASVRRRIISHCRRLVREKLSKGSFRPFLLRLNARLRLFDPKSSYFSQFKPINIIKTYPNQIIKSKLRKLEAREEKKLKNPSSTMSQAPVVLAPKLKYLFRGFHHQVRGISLVDFFHPLGP